MNSSRRPHRKTRTGCSQCKRRKIKCDESRPSCKNCVRHSYDCDFASIPSSQAVPTVSLPGSGSSRLSNSPSTWPQSNPSPVNHRVTLVDVIPAQPFSLNLIDLELLHNFSTSTSQTISNEPIIRTLWRINVPQLGFQHEFVMRGILAMSALHMAQFHPHKAEFYVSHSLAHQQIGLQIVSGILPNINEENCSAIYIFSAMIAMCALAGPRRPDDLLVGTDVDNGASEWLHLFRGVRSIIDSAYPTLSSGTLGPMFQAGARRFLLREIEPIDDSNLQELRRLIQRTVHESDAKQAYLSAVDTLQNTISYVYSGPPEEHEPADAFVWLYRVNEDYLQLLRERTQVALTIFGFACVLLKRLEFQWWVRGWSTHIISIVYNLVDEEHRLWLRWPIEEIGWIPSLNDVSS